MRISTELLLREFGFTVLVARDGAEAIEVFRSSPVPIDVVLLDLSMPRMNGIETLRELRRIDPTVPVVITSGYGSIGVENEPQPRDEPDAVLPKPYAQGRLVATLRRVMRN